MTPAHLIETSLSTLGFFLAAMAVLAAIETLIPLHAHRRRAHLATNLALTSLTLGMNLFLNVALGALLLWLEARGFGLLRWLALPPLAAGVIAFLVFDLSFYAQHVSWHRFPSMWRIHSVHHSDPIVDVTTTVRQHPMESLMRYGVMAAVAIAIGPSAAAFAAYRAASALVALLEHSNVRAPRWLDGALSLVTTWPYVHKVHHSRAQAHTDSNYGNVFSFWDRMFGTFTPAQHGTALAYGLDGLDDPELLTTSALLRMPFRRREPLEAGVPS